jgi:hypothetical protein
MSGLNFILGSLIPATLTVWLTGCAATRPDAKDPMPAFVNGARILFQGDSITDGNRGRNTDPNHILGHGYQFSSSLPSTARKWPNDISPS